MRRCLVLCLKTLLSGFASAQVLMLISFKYFWIQFYHLQNKKNNIMITDKNLIEIKTTIYVPTSKT